jgi:tripartite-type tricarboxylate transporter receptor subunit TctC
MTRCIWKTVAAATMAATCLSPAMASDNFPNRPIKLLVGFPAGGPTDITMRAIAENASKRLGQPVIVENKGGAGGTLPASTVQMSQPDGYTIGQAPLGIFRMGYVQKMSWDPLKDLSYIINLTGYTFGLTVPANSPFNSWQDFVAYAKANPGKITYGSAGGNLTSPHLTMERIAEAAGIQLTHVPFKGSADLSQALLGGHVMAAADSSAFVPYVESGQAKLLNVWGDKRMERFPNVPTLKELGIDIVQTSPYGLVAPKGTPPAVVQKLHDAFKQALEEKSSVEALAKYDMLPNYMGSAQYTQFAQDVSQREKEIIQRLGLDKVRN